MREVGRQREGWRAERGGGGVNRWQEKTQRKKMTGERYAGRQTQPAARKGQVHCHSILRRSYKKKKFEVIKKKFYHLHDNLGVSTDEDE